MRYKSSCVVTIFSTNELSLASCRVRVLMRIVSLGIVNATPLSSANLQLAETSLFIMALVSRSKGKGNRGISYFYSCLIYIMFFIPVLLFPSSPPRSHSPLRYSRAIATNHAFLCHVIQQGDVEFQKPFIL